MGEFVVKELGNLLSEKGYVRGPFGSSLKRGEMVDEGVPVYEQKNAIYNNRDFRFFITPEKFKELKRFQVRTNDLIISCSGTVGKISIIAENDPKGIISQALLILRPDIKKITLRFLYYFLSSRQGFNLITQASHGSVQINIAARKVVETIPVPAPPLPEQKAIASVLSSLDDKIDLLHRQNKTLEAMAETLFRQWFVEEADEGWEVVKLDYCGSLKNGINYSRDENGDTQYSILNVRDIVESKYLHKSKLEIVNIDAKKAEPYLLESNDIIIVRSASPGESTIILEYQEGVIYSGFSIRFRPKNKQLTLYLFLLLQNFKRELDIYSDGTTLKNLNQGILKDIDVLLPPENKIKDFNSIVRPLFDKIVRNISQIRTLEKLRDTLLPKLISGEVRVEYEDN